MHDTLLPSKSAQLASCQSVVTGKRSRLLPALVVLLSVAFTGCQVTTTIIKPQDHYDMAVPRKITNITDNYKADFAANKLEDQEIDPNTPDDILLKRFESDFERAVSALYVGNLKTEESLDQVFELIKYATNMFAEDEIFNQLHSRSASLSDFVIHYQINAALNQPDF